MTTKGQTLDKLYYIVNGRATASDSNTLILGSVEPYHFIGELSYLRHLKKDHGEVSIASATVMANELITAWEWSHKDIDMILEDRDLANAFSSYCSHDLKRKLLSANRKGGIPAYLKEKYDPDHKYEVDLPDEMKELYVNGKFDEGVVFQSTIFKALISGSCKSVPQR